jgi:hypothetical protein
VHEPFVGEQLLDVWRIFFIEIVVQQHVEPKDHGYKCVGYKKKVCLKKMQQFSYEKNGVGMHTYCWNANRVDVVIFND